MSTQPNNRPLRLVLGVLAGMATVTALVAIAYTQGFESYARGMAIGGAGGIGTVAILNIVGERAGTFGRLMSGGADERDDVLVTKAMADASLGMFLGSLAGIVAGMYGMPGPIVGGVVLWAGLLAGLGSYLVRSRRL